MNEELRDIPGFPDYSITRDGRIWSKPKHGSSTTGKWMSLAPHRDGHLYVGLRKDGARHCPKVHRLVLETYVGPCPEGMECCHNNGDPADNRVENLRWDTRKANIQDSVRHGTHRVFSTRGEDQWNHKLTEQQVRQIIYTYRTGLFTQKEIGAQYGVSRMTVGDIVNQRTWGHLWAK